MTKTQIFDDIVSIVKNDASFCKDECGADEGIYRKMISDDMEDEAFLYAVRAFLASYGVMGHLSFRDSTRGFLSFTVKRYQGALYVDSVASNSLLRVGDKIIGIDDFSVKEYGQRHETMLYGEKEERQGDAWFSLLSFAHSITVDRDGTTITLPIVLDGEWEEEERYSCKQLRNNIVYIRLKDFSDDVAINTMYQENDALLRNSEYLIIDVRGNEGGNDSAYVPLFQFCMAEGESIATLKKGPFDSGIEINYTERNCDYRLKRFESILDQDIPDATRSLLSRFVTELKQNRGKGFIAFGSNEDSESEPTYVGTTLPKKVYVITDESCASSGDAFVHDISKCSKVTVVGRPTMGILDYSNCSAQAYDQYLLVYPTSRSLYLDNGVQMRRYGVPVDIHIPWTPEHCQRDVDLNTVIALIESDV